MYATAFEVLFQYLWHWWNNTALIMKTSQF